MKYSGLSSQWWYISKMTIFRLVPFKFPGHNYLGGLYDKSLDPACFDHEILYYSFYKTLHLE